MKAKDRTTRVHKARKQALPDFHFNKTILDESDDRVKLQINLSGTHTGVIDCTGIVRRVLVIQPTDKKVNLPSEYFTYKDDWRHTQECWCAGTGSNCFK